MDYGVLSLQEIKNCYSYSENGKAYICGVCGAVFVEGQVYPSGDKYYAPEAAVTEHIEDAHGGAAAVLINSETKYNKLTDNQRELLLLFNGGASDNEIAKRLGVSASTVRRQKFNFREKAKQAKLYLACIESVFNAKEAGGNAFIPIHNSATHIDDRYITTENERDKILNSYFISLDPLKLKSFPAKEKRKVVVLAKIAEAFAPYTDYAEKEVNAIINGIFDDHALIRRFLVIYGFMERDGGGQNYRLRI